MQMQVERQRAQRIGSDAKPAHRAPRVSGVLVMMSLPIGTIKPNRSASRLPAPESPISRRVRVSSRPQAGTDGRAPSSPPRTRERPGQVNAQGAGSVG